MMAQDSHGMQRAEPRPSHIEVYTLSTNKACMVLVQVRTAAARSDSCSLVVMIASSSDHALLFPLAPPPPRKKGMSML